MTARSNSFRRYDLDWLRIFGICTVFIFHCVIIFSIKTWFVSNNESSHTLYLLFVFLVTWMMPLFFVISGSAMYYSLKKYDVKKYLKNRICRIFVPFIFGIFFLAPIIVYVERIFFGGYSGSFFQFFLNEYFQGFYGYNGNFAWMGLHLWYLLFLIIFTFIMILPAKHYLKTREKPLFDNLTRFFRLPGAILLLSIPIIILDYISILEPRFIGLKPAGWAVLPCFAFFYFGFLFAYDSRYHTIIDKNWKLSFIIAFISMSIILIMVSTDLYAVYKNHIAESVLFGLASISALIALFGFFQKYMQKESKILSKMNEAVLPVYIIHVPIIVIVGFFIIKLNFSIAPKLIVIMLASSFFTICAYFIISRVNILRFVFGMKLKK